MAALSKIFASATTYPYQVIRTRLQVSMGFLVAAAWGNSQIIKLFSQIHSQFMKRKHKRNRERERVIICGTDFRCG